MQFSAALFGVRREALTNKKIFRTHSARIYLPPLPCVKNPGWIFYPPSELYAKLTLRSLTALKMASKCSATKCKPRFLDHFCLVMKHNSSFAVASSVTQYPNPALFRNESRRSRMVFCRTGFSPPAQRACQDAKKPRSGLFGILL
uniref:Uncharacterized protein n=1 Tax=Candidatus Kentrum sp. DK TaxID=2126562 RepID=A0A450SDV8_9GAMM|nr:MAG: hypothetical protein BECKDK2373B_GA0170837_103020 [Candidatus Kentron sp. DK]